MKVTRKVDTEDGPVTTQVEACEHRVPTDEECKACEDAAWDACKS